VRDDQGVSVTCPKTALNPGEGMVCIGSGMTVLGPYENLGTVKALYGVVTVSDSDPSHYLGLQTWVYVHLPLVLR
jgi:hypothetical protein